MSVKSVNNVEDLIARLNARHEQLLEALRGTPMAEGDLRLRQLHGPHVTINPRDLRLAIADVATVLTEAKKLEK